MAKDTSVIHVRESLRIGWDIFKERSGFFIVLGIIMILLQGVMYALELIPFVGFLMSWVLNAFIGAGVTYIFLQAYDKQSATYSDVFSQKEHVLRYIGVAFVTTAIIFGGMALLFIPGIVASIALFFPLYLVVDRKMPVFEAVRTSWAITKGYRVKIAMLLIAIAVINILGLLALVIGLFVTVPVSALAMTHVYRALLAHAEKNNLLPVKKLQTVPKIFFGLGIVVVIAGAVAVFFMPQQDDFLDSPETMNALLDAHNDVIKQNL